MIGNLLVKHLLPGDMIRHGTSTNYSRVNQVEFVTVDGSPMVLVTTDSLMDDCAPTPQDPYDLVFVSIRGVSARPI